MQKILIASAIFTIGTGAFAADCGYPINLKAFHENPKDFLNAPVVKLDANCNAVKKAYFSNEQVESNEFVALKDEQRKNFCHTTKDGTSKICLADLEAGQDVVAGRAPIQSVDLAENLVTGDTIFTKLEEMEELELVAGKVEKQPWSDWYWPIAVGQLSFRYGDSSLIEAYQAANLQEAQIWPWMNDYYTNHPATPNDINKLSPSEKYDLLMGDSNYTLTKMMLEAGRPYYEQYGKVEGWMGLCHGWAPASYMLDRPLNSITVKASDKVTDIHFRPSDLKALGTLLWASGNQQNKFIGGRCNKKDPEIDSESGRVLDQECFDNNPGSWHQAVVAEVGFNKRPFVMDATYDYEVWNHPVVSYKYTYFNPKTMEKEIPLQTAKLDIRAFDNDKFKKFRSPKAQYVVGVMMQVEYMVETMPSTYEFDNESMDAARRAYYVYDLELDAQGKIIGGEWYSNKHPDFLWTPYEGSHAESILDQYLPETLGLELITHPEIVKYVPEVSANSQPVGKVVEALIREAAKKVDVGETK